MRHTEGQNTSWKASLQLAKPIDDASERGQAEHSLSRQHFLSTDLLLRALMRIDGKEANR